MAENKIILKSVSELLGMKFFIPSYQRGYRWTEQQVEDLLNDINEFKPEKVNDKEETWYCLQPLVVKKMPETDSRLTDDDKKDWYEVIDGQQRLTTIYIILKLIEDDGEFPAIQYQTRPNSGSFLINIKNENNESNIDYHFMLSTKNAVINYPNKLEKDFVNKLKNSCKVIWYETDDDAYEVFKRLNSGKISLSNAELVKALLLKDDNFRKMNTDALRIKQLEMAGEWDRMEQTLHDNSFWYFINPQPEDARFECTRIDFLLEMILRSKKNDKNEYKYNIENELKLNDYFIFSTYSENIAKEGWEIQWSNIQRFFRIMKAWYDNRQLYHYIGYLMNRKGIDKMAMLRDLLCDAEKPKDDFLFSLIKRCQETIGIGVKHKEKEEIITKVSFEGWKYGPNNDEIHNVLLLFNLATTQNQISEVSRYPFDKHFEAAKKKWSLEHIHAQNEKPKMEWTDAEVNQLKQFARSFRFVAGETDTVDQMAKDFANAITKESLVEKDENGQFNLYRIIVGAMMGISIKRLNNTFVLEPKYFEKDDHLTNMALLQGDKNAAFNNKLYPEKRAKLAEYENVENESLFVPICTRNVFFKHYSPNSTNPLLWDEQAGKEYVTAMTKVVAAYLQLEAVLPKENNELKYGVKLKES